MEKKKSVAIMITVPREARDLLRRLAAKTNWENPNKITTPAGLSRDIILEFLKNHGELDPSNTF